MGVALGGTAAYAAANLGGVVLEAIPLQIAEREANDRRREAEKVAQLAQERRDFLEATKGVVWGPRPKTAAKP